MENKQKIEEIKKILDKFKRFEINSLTRYVSSLKDIDKIVNS